jgi:hypothetical protein
MSSVVLFSQYFKWLSGKQKQLPARVATLSQHLFFHLPPAREPSASRKQLPFARGGEGTSPSYALPSRNGSYGSTSRWATPVQRGNLRLPGRVPGLWVINYGRRIRLRPRSPERHENEGRPCATLHKRQRLWKGTHPAMVPNRACDNRRNQAPL